MIPYRIRTNFHELEKWLAEMATRQVPFATAKALTRTAQDAQADVRAGLGSRFEIRSPWISGGIRIVPASKRDWPHAFSAVGSRDDFMALQEKGGEKRASKGAKNVAIPTKASTARRGAGGRIPRSRKPRALLDRSDVFVSGKAIRRRPKRKGAKLETLFLLRPVARVRARFGFRETVERTVARVYAHRFREAFESAIKAPKRPGPLR